MKDVEIFVVTGIIITLLFIAFIISFLLVNQRRHFYYLKEKQELKNTFQQTLLQSQLEIQEQTLQHIGRELHDNLGHIASIIKINLTTLTKDLDDSTKALDKIEATKELTRQLIGDLKSLSVSLGADRIAQSGLAKALETEVDRLNKTGQFTTTITQEGNLPAIEKDKVVILFRMAQEILNNMVKHSVARHITVGLNASENSFILAFSDDGVGFDTDEKKNSGGAGLRNLQHRAKLINAQLTMQSSPGNGSRVTIELPL
jgi:signal transduction histidine kinase